MDDRSSSHDTPASPEEQWLTTLQAAEQTGRHRETIRRWIRSGALQPRRGVGGQQEIRLSDLQKLAGDGVRGHSSSTDRSERSQILLPSDRTIVIDE